MFLDELPPGLYRISPRSKHTERGDERKRSGVAGWHSCDASRCVCFARYEPLHSPLCRVPRERSSNGKKIAWYGRKWIAVIWWFVVSSIPEEPETSGGSSFLPDAFSHPFERLRALPEFKTKPAKIGYYFDRTMSLAVRHHIRMMRSRAKSLRKR